MSTAPEKAAANPKSSGCLAAYLIAPKPPIERPAIDVPARSVRVAK
jgi:hypothetical protein